VSASPDDLYDRVTAERVIDEKRQALDTALVAVMDYYGDLLKEERNRVKWLEKQLAAERERTSTPAPRPPG
jgi:hypothetical protein